MKLQQAAQQEDSPQLSHDLTLALSRVPPDQRSNGRFKDAMATSALLESKYAGISAMAFPPDKYVLLNLTMPSAETAVGPRMWCGTGFLINKDGLILTNRHVAKGAKTLMVTVDGGAQTTAEVISVSDGKMTRSRRSPLRRLLPPPSHGW